MPAITDPDDIAYVLSQLSAPGQTPPVRAGTTAPAPSSGAITDPDELAYVRAQLTGAVGAKSPSPTSGADTDPNILAQVAAALRAGKPSAPASLPAPSASGADTDPAIMAQVHAQLTAPAAPPPAPVALPQASPSLPGATMEAMPDRGFAGAIEDGVRMLVAPLMGSRAAAALDTVTGTGLPNADYAKNLANEEAKTKWVQAEHPYASQILGGAGTLGAGAAALAAAPEEGILGGATHFC